MLDAFGELMKLVSYNFFNLRLHNQEQLRQSIVWVYVKVWPLDGIHRYIPDVTTQFIVS